MKISGVKFGINIDVGELDLDLKDIIDVKRLDWEQRRQEAKEFQENERRIAELRKAGPSSETKTFIEAIVSKAITKIKEEIAEQIKTGGKRKPVDPDERIED